jgi:hypothetical protein
MVEQGCQIGLFETKFQKYGFFQTRLASQNSFGLFYFFLAFLHAKIICTKMTYHPFSKSFSFWFFFCQLHLAIFLPPRVWARRHQPPTGKSAEHGHMTRPGTCTKVNDQCYNCDHSEEILFLILILKNFPNSHENLQLKKSLSHTCNINLVRYSTVLLINKPSKNLHVRMQIHVRKPHRDSFYIFRQQGDLLHF